MRRSTTIYILILIAACGLAYANTLNHEFVHDDKLEILENKNVHSLTNIPKALTASAWGWQENLGADNPSNYYRPAQTVTYALLYSAFGNDPKPFHVYKLVLHVLCTLLVFLIGVEMVRDGKKSLLAGLLFALHPMHVESVTWIAGITDVNCALFSLASFLFFLKYLRAGRRRQYVLSAACFFLALLSKEIALMMLPLFFIYKYLFGSFGDTLTQGDMQKGARPLFGWRYVPYFLLTGIYLALRVNALGGFAPEGKYLSLTGLQVLLNAFPLLLKYFEKLLLPLSFNFHYTFDPVLSVYNARFLASFALTGGLIFSMVVLKKKYPFYMFCLCWTILTLLPVLDCQILGRNVFTERYLYLPSVGFCLLASEFFFWAFRKRGLFQIFVKEPLNANVRELHANDREYHCHPDPERSEGEGSEKSRFFARVRSLRMTESFRYVSCIMMVSVLMFYFLQTVRRNRVLENDLTLWQATVIASPEDAFVRKALGNALAEAGQIDEAIGQYAEALRVDPDYEGVHDNWGTLLAREGKADEAIEHYREALRIDPDSMAGYINLGNLLAGQGEWKEAQAQYLQALRVAPGSPDAYNGLGRLLATQGKAEEAMAQYEEALRLDPDNTFTHNNIGNILAGRGDFGQALEHYSRAVKADPDFTDARYNAANILLRQGKDEEAIGHYQDALRTNPGDINGHYDLGNILAHQRKFEEAIDQYNEVLKMEPAALDARNNLAVILMEQGQLEEAIRQFEEVLRIDPNYPNARAGLNIALQKLEKKTQ